MALRRKRRSEPRIDRSAPGWEVPSSFNFTRDVIESLAARDTLRKGVAYVDTEGIVDRRTFADIAKDAARWAHLLRTRLDRRDRVLVVLGLTLVGESLNDLADPRLRKRAAGPEPVEDLGVELPAPDGKDER